MPPYRSPAEDERSYTLPFDELLPATKTSLAAASGRGSRVLLMQHQTPWWHPSRWFTVALLSGVLVAARLLHDSTQIALAEIARRDAQQLAALVALEIAGLGAFAARRAQRRARGQQLHPGLYLFGRDLIDARSHDLRVWPTTTLSSVSSSGGRLTLCFHDGARFHFDAPHCDPEALAHHIERARAAADQAAERGDLETLGALDPLAPERPRWGKSQPPPSRPRRRAPWLLAAALPLLLFALLSMAGRALGIQHAVVAHEINDLAWLATSDRLLSGWAERRWAEAVLASDCVGEPDLFIQIADHPAPVARRLEARLDDCAGDRRAPCVHALRSLCGSREQRDDVLLRGLARISPRELENLPRCAELAARHTTTESLRARWHQRALAESDARTLWELGAFTERRALFERELARLDRSGTPTARALRLALAHHLEHPGEIDIRVEVGGVEYHNVSEERAYSRWRHEAGSLLRRELMADPAGKLLELRLTSPGSSPRGAELIAHLGMASVGVGSVRIDQLTWSARLPVDRPLREGQPPGEEALAPLLGLLPLDLPRAQTFVAPLDRPLELPHPVRSLPMASQLRLLDQLL